MQTLCMDTLSPLTPSSELNWEVGVAWVTPALFSPRFNSLFSDRRRSCIWRLLPSAEQQYYKVSSCLFQDFLRIACVPRKLDQ